MPWKYYHVSFGNSANGPIGGVMQVAARSPEEALGYTREVLTYSTFEVMDDYDFDSRRVAYVNLYTGPPEAFTLGNVGVAIDDEPVTTCPDHSEDLDEDGVCPVCG